MPADVKNAADLRKIIDDLPNTVIITTATAPDKNWIGAKDMQTIEDGFAAIKARNPQLRDKETDFELATRRSHTVRLAQAVGKAANVSRFKPVTKVTKIDEGAPA